MKYITKTVAWSAVLVTLSACVSTSEVAQLDRNTYTLGTTAGAGGPTNNELLVRTAQKATAFCDERGEDMVRTDTEMGGIRGYTRRELTFNFRCVPR